MAGNDSDVEIMFVCRTKLVGRSEMRVTLREDFNRQPLPDTFEKNINDVWNDRVAKNLKLYNGTKFRIDSVAERDEGILNVNLGVTCYKEYLGTNWSPSVSEIHSLGKKKAGNSQIHLSDPLGVGSFVVTSDEKVIFLKRSKYCAEAPATWDLPGGHAEPMELVGKIPFEEIDLSTMDPPAVVNEIFDSIIREIRDEVNLPESSLTDPELIGIARNTTSAGRPSMEFFVRCSLKSTEVEELYHKGSQAEADESTNIQTIPLDDVISMETNNKSLWSNLAPSAKGCIYLYKLANDL